MNATETKTQHTPGPWYAANMGNDHQGLIIAEGSGANIAVSYDKEDANLIAAAPDLLQSVKDLSEQIDVLRTWLLPTTPPLVLACTTDNQSHAQAAIAKAEEL